MGIDKLLIAGAIFHLTFFAHEHRLRFHNEDKFDIPIYVIFWGIHLYIKNVNQDIPKKSPINGNECYLKFLKKIYQHGYFEYNMLTDDQIQTEIWLKHVDQPDAC